MTVDIEFPTLQSNAQVTNKSYCFIRKSNMKHREFEYLRRRFVIKDSLWYITLLKWIISCDVLKDLEV
jgi:hypothetical protein